MENSLLFIPDISGFTNFIQTTEIEHSQHVIAELLEVLIASNTLNLSLAEIEGDALFFYKENSIPSKEKLLVQIETMYTAFYSHLKLLEKNRICPCLACSSAVNLELKIITHAGYLQFIEVQKKRKPFGKTVIEIHRLLKNSITSSNYVLISNFLFKKIDLNRKLESIIFNFKEGYDKYDGKNINYIFSEIDVKHLNIKPFLEKKPIQINRTPNLVLERIFQIDSNTLLEKITNYKYRHLWTEGAHEIKFNPNQVTRIESNHVCVIDDKHFDFEVVTKNNIKGDVVYGEKTTSTTPFDTLYQFYDITYIDNNKSKLTLEIYWETKSIIKKILIALFIKKFITKNAKISLDKLKNIL